jgi:hypothetical protein
MTPLPQIIINPSTITYYKARFSEEGDNEAELTLTSAVEWDDGEADVVAGDLKYCRCHRLISPIGFLRFSYKFISEP